MPGTPYNGIGLAQRILKYQSNSNSGSDGTAITRSPGGLSSINAALSGGKPVKSFARCQASNVPVAFDRNLPVISDGLYRYSAYRSC